MADWQQSFAKRLGELREGWLRAFDRVSDEDIAPAFRQLEYFLTNNGFSVSTPRTEGEIRSFKFALGEDAYVILYFRLHGPLEVEAANEVFVGGRNDISPSSECVPLQSINASGAQKQFQGSLDRLGEAPEAKTTEPATACV